MSSDVESFFCDYLRTTHFSIQLDESTLPGNEALLLAYVRFVMGEQIHEELLFAKTLKTDTKAESIFTVLSDFFKEKSISATIDRVPAMVGRYRGFISHLKIIIPEIECLDEDIQTYVQHLIALNDDFKFRFEDILSMEIPPWIINPFDEMEVENVILQKELLELSTNEELKMTLKRGYQKFWLLAEIPEKYPGLWELCKSF
ncbi:Zinc finger BED domain-containing protein 5 [Eumeta japonica]|uniref:Zinc finger BED domain-containing protein 5 n=1 Tax=Eumeta variegata TaxID=151549 RepID=A0A4C1Z1L1_EUMVA|nr:Zinc finger BED domain-containing protein 5 [Eumeta japonica]